MNHYELLRGDRTLRSCWSDAPVSSTREPVKMSWPNTGRVRSVLTERVWSHETLTGPLLDSTGRWTLRVRSALTGRVRSLFFQVWTLTGVDRTLALSVRSHDLPASGHTRLNHLSQTNWPDPAASVRSVFDPPFTSNFRTYVNEVCSKGS